MKLRYFRQSKLDALKANIVGNMKRYLEDEEWVEKYYSGTAWDLESNIDWVRPVELKLPDENGLYDLENTKLLYTNLKHLSLGQATDERLWAYMTHLVYWRYMRKRWPLKGKESPEVYLRERYFFGSNRDRALVRNGLARLWWYGYVSYDSKRENPYELTGALLFTLDIAQSLLERSFSRNENIARGILKVLAGWRAEKHSMPRRDTFRFIMQHLNRLGGVTVLDALSEESIRHVVRKKLEELWAQRESHPRVKSDNQSPQTMQ